MNNQSVSARTSPDSPRYTVRYADGTSPQRGVEFFTAVALVSQHCGVDVGALVLSIEDTRTLVWTSEEAADNNDGSRAVAELINAADEQETSPDFSRYTVPISDGPSYYGSDCTQADADRIAASLTTLIEGQFPGVKVVTSGLRISGPDQEVIDEINNWISDNWTAAL